MATATESPARIEVREQAVDALYEQAKPVHSKALEALIGIGDGDKPTAAGDAMYRDLKNDSRVFKPVKGEASFALTKGARGAITRKINARKATA